MLVGDGLLEHLLDVRLDHVVERQIGVPALVRRALADDIDRAPERVLHDRLAPGPATEVAVERELEACEPAVVQARVPEHLRGDTALRVAAALLGIEPEPGHVLPLELRGVDAERPAGRERR